MQGAARRTVARTTAEGGNAADAAFSSQPFGAGRIRRRALLRLGSLALANGPLAAPTPPPDSTRPRATANTEMGSKHRKFVASYAGRNRQLLYVPECSKAGEGASKSSCGGFDSMPGMPKPPRG